MAEDVKYGTLTLTCGIFAARGVLSGFLEVHCGLLNK